MTIPKKKKIISGGVPELLEDDWCVSKPYRTELRQI
jgi:hypothetical protein